MTVLKKALRRIDDFNEGFLEFDKIDDSVQEFLFSMQLFCHKDGTFKEDRKKILEVQLTLKALEVELKKDWNHDRSRKKIGENSSSHLAGPIIPDSSAPSDDKFECLNSEKKRHAEAMNDGECVVTPNDNKRVKFARISPKLDMMPNFGCQVCFKKFVWLKALKRHLKAQHQIEEVSKDLKEVEDRVTCRICKSRVARDMLTRHLKTKHKIEKLGSKSIFRGFLTINGLQWQPLWLDKTEKDPPSELMVPINEDGTVTLYGIQFQVEEREMNDTENKKKETVHKEVVRKRGAENGNKVKEIEIGDVELDDQKVGQGTDENKAEHEKKGTKAASVSGALNDGSSGQYGEETLLYDMDHALSNDNFHLSPTFKKVVKRDSWFDSSCKSRDLLVKMGNGVESDKEDIDVTNVEKEVATELEKKGNNKERTTQLYGSTGNQTDEEILEVERTENTDNENDVAKKEQEDEAPDFDLGFDFTTNMLDIGDDEAESRLDLNLGGETVNGSDVGKINLAFDVQDEFCQHEDLGSDVKDGADQVDSEGRKPLPKLKVEVFSVIVEDGEFWSSEHGEWETDSDFELNDDKSFTEARLEMKRLRFAYFTPKCLPIFKIYFFRMERRNGLQLTPKLSELEPNVKIIQEFDMYLKTLKFKLDTTSSELSTLRKQQGHLFLYSDSLLNFLSSRIPDYNLECHFKPMDKCVEVEDPTSAEGWIQSVGGPSGKENPGRRKEMLKSHARWRDFCTEKLRKQDFGSSAEGFIKKESLIKNLEQISEKIKKKQVFSKLSKLEEQRRIEKEKARAVVYPSNNFREQNSVKVWFASSEAKEEEAICIKIYEKTLAGAKSKQKEYLRFANWARFSLMLEDRNRRSVYSFSNKDFAGRSPKWLPENKEENLDTTVDRFELLPNEWDPDTPPSLGVQPTCFVMKLSGSSKGLKLKGDKPATIIMTQRSVEILQKFKDLKYEVFESFEDDEQFFVGFHGKPLAAMQRTPGSLLFKLGEVCGISNFTVNTVRRAAEVKVQASPAMKSNVENLQSHSRNVGLKHYDRSGENTRASFINQLSAIDSPLKAVQEVTETVKMKRQQKEIKEREKILENAKETLAMDKFSKKEELTKKCKLRPEDRRLLQEFFASGECKELISKRAFPGNL